MIKNGQNKRKKIHHFLQFGGLLPILARFLSACVAAAAQPNAATNSFPTPAEVLQGRTFANQLERDEFFLRAIHNRYPSQWPRLLDANITVTDYVESPAKLLRFVDELGVAMEDRNDPAASARLAWITSDKSFFANTNGYHPEIQQAAARALIKIGPVGRKALASSFSESHYRDDPASLEDLAKVIGKEHPSDPDLAKALATTAFNFSTTDGGSYPRCTSEAVQNLLRLPEGVSAVRTNLNKAEVFADPGRFQAVTDGIAAAHAADLTTNLVALNNDAKAKLETLTNSPGAYRDDLQQLEAGIQKTIAGLASK